MITETIDRLDERILRLIASDARMPFLEVSRQCSVSGAAVHQRYQRLVREGVIKGSTYTLDPAKLGYGTCAFIGVLLKDPEDYDKVVEKLEHVPEVVECHYTSGKYDMFIKIYARDNAHLLEIIHDKLQPLCLGRSETIISFREGLHRQLPIPELHKD